MPDTLDHHVAITTVETAEDAARIAHIAVERGLAACVQIVGPIRSIYRWKGAVESASEHRLEFKTRRAHLEALEALVTAQHPYEVPEWVVLPIVAGSTAYLRFIDEGTS